MLFVGLDDLVVIVNVSDSVVLDALGMEHGLELHHLLRRIHSS